ncbi:hypothetical protein Syun_021358 [Stephania yunnanensis]|uniref:Uncharacterized protein n=1 Tax=Stephania yunnanensis TaxID=152371 RepID=A0AAP0IFI5_9MAGN
MSRRGLRIFFPRVQALFFFSCSLLRQLTPCPPISLSVSSYLHHSCKRGE